MAEERVFLNEGNIYVSNTRIVLDETTYATANVTSVRKTFTPANKRYAKLLILAAVLVGISSVSAMSLELGTGLRMLALACVSGSIGVVWLQSLKPTYHVMLASASGERQGLSSQDGGVVSRATIAIADAITHRG
jgi:hypothetical protein